MARIRAIKPEFFRHEALYEAERASGLPLRVAFAGLWTAADREGRFRWQPRALKLDCLPYDDVDFGVVLDMLGQCGFIVKYQFDGGGDQYGYIPGFNKHQHINQREAQSTLPAPPDACTCTHVTAHGEGKGKEGKGNERGGGVRTREELVSREAIAVAEEVMAIFEIDREFTPPGWCGAAMRIQSGMNEGWKREIILLAARKIAANKRDGPPDNFTYLEKPIAREHANANKPIPVEAASNVQANQRHPGGAYGASKDRFREAHADLKAFIAEQDSGDGSGQIVELLPTPRRG